MIDRKSLVVAHCGMVEKPTYGTPPTHKAFLMASNQAYARKLFAA